MVTARSEAMTTSPPLTAIRRGRSAMAIAPSVGPPARGEFEHHRAGATTLDLRGPFRVLGRHAQAGEAVLSELQSRLYPQRGAIVFDRQVPLAEPLADLGAGLEGVGVLRRQAK